MSRALRSLAWATAFVVACPTLSVEAQSASATRRIRLALAHSDSAAASIVLFANSSSSRELAAAIKHASIATTHFEGVARLDSSLASIRHGLRRISGPMGVELQEALRREGYLSNDTAVGLATWGMLLRMRIEDARAGISPAARGVAPKPSLPQPVSLRASRPHECFPFARHCSRRS